jgi:nitrogen fixation protein FixH
MRHQKVKILAFFLAVFIAVASFPALKSNAAGGEIPNSNLTWTLDGNGKLTIDGTGAMPYWSAAANVPWNSSKSNIKTVEIKSGVTTIGPYAFRSHSNLTSISIPSTVTSIGSYSFQNCNKLTAIIIPNSVTSIGSYAFTSCTTLSSLSLSSNLTEIGNDAFKSCKALTSVSIPNGVTTISANAFNGCESMTTLSIPNSVTTIDEYAFYKCSKLNSVILPSSLITIGKAAFGYCSTITSITVPNGVNTIGVDAFACCTSLTAVTLPDSLLHIYNGAFRNCSNLSSINIPNELMFIGTNAFGYCSALTTFSIPASITTFGFDALGNTGVSKVTYKGTRSQWLNIDTLYDPELNWDMDKEMAKYNIEVIFSNGTNELTITSNPSNVTGKVGNTATFSVRATGDGLTYQWNEFVDGEWVACTYTGSTTANLKVPITCNKDGRRYDCTVTDTYGLSKTSTSATLTIDRTNLMINSAPVNFTGQVGETAVFVVGAQGDELTYQWQVFKDGEWTNCSINDGAKTAALSFEIKATANGNRYQCIITDGYGNSVTTKEVVLTIKTPLNITSQPSNASGFAGETATYTIAARGDNLSYQWQVFKDGAWTNCSMNDGAKTATLSFEIKATLNGNKYHCIITDGYGDSVTSNEVTLTVKTPVSITSQPSNVSGFAGETATFTVGTVGDNLAYQWQVFKDGAWTNASMNDGAKTATLSFEIKANANGNKYHCIINDGYGNTVTTSEVTLTVKTAAGISTQPSNCSGFIGDIATFTIVAAGDNLSYQWQVFKDGAWTNCSMNDGAKTATLSFEIKATANGNKYHCVITDGYGNSVTSSEVTLTAKTHLAITSEPGDFSGRVGSTATFTVGAVGDGLTYQWQVLKDGEWTNCSMNDGAKTATLSFEIKATANGNKYHCIVTDSRENSLTTKEVTLTAILPITITNQPVNFSGQAGDTAVFSVTANGNSLKYQWQTFKSGAWANCSNNDGARTNTLTLEAKSSRNGTIYRCVITDADNNTVNTNEVTMTVITPLAITTQPSNFKGVIGDTAVFTVKATGDDLKYQWQVYKSGAWSNCSVNDGAKTNKLSLEVKDSRNGTKYRCTITDVRKNTVTTNEVTLTVDIPLEILVQPVDYSGAENSTAVFTVSAQGVGLKYQWQVYKSGAWSNCSVNDGAKTKTLSLEAKASRHGTKYRCVITDANKESVKTNTVTLSVLIPLEIVTQPVNYSGPEGSSAVFTVKANGVGLKYQWQVYKSGAWTNCSVNDGAKTNKLTLEAKASRSGTKYRCVVTDANGENVKTNTVILTVEIPLEIVSLSDNFTGNEGETATYSIEAKGIGLKYQWQVFKNGEWTNCSINDGAKTATLSFTIKASQNGNKYHCIVTDSTGASVTSREVYLKVIGTFANQIDIGNTPLAPNQVVVEPANAVETVEPAEAADAVDTAETITESVEEPAAEVTEPVEAESDIVEEVS